MSTPGESLQAAAPADWVAESKILQEALLYLRTLRAAVNHPWRFSSEWASGERRVMNPLTFFSISIGLVFAARGFGRWLYDDQTPQALLEGSAAPSYGFTVLLGLYLHWVMLRRTGARLSLTVGALFFALGSWGTVASLMSWLARTGEPAVPATPSAVFEAAFIGRAAFNILTKSAAVSVFIAGAHRKKISTSFLYALSFYVGLPGGLMGLGWLLAMLGAWLVT